MLAPALKVVDAARALNPVRIVAGKPLWKLGIAPMAMSEAFRDLGEALEEFDRHSGNNNDAREMLGRAIRYAAERGIPAEEMISAISAGNVETEDEVRAIDSSIRLRPKPGDLGRPDPVQDGTPVIVYDTEFGADVEIAPQYKPPAPVFEADSKQLPAELQDRIHQAATDLALLPVFRDRWAALAARVGYEHDHTFVDAGNYDGDAGVAFDLISDRLEYAVKIHGWTPKLKALAAAWLHARAKMSLDMDAGLNIAPEDAAIIALCSADLARIEENPDYAYETDELGWQHPTPRHPGF